MPWIPTETEKTAAVALLSELLAVPEDDQLDVLCLLVNLWCYHENQRKGRTAR